jgi:beta-lactamase class A
MSRSRLLLLVVLGVALCGPAALASKPRHKRRVALVFPSPAQVAAAKRYVGSRAGIVSFTVVDPRGKRYSFGDDRQFVSASVVKAMLMTCLLDIRSLAHEPLSATDRSELQAMITLSDNEAADEIYDEVGDVHLYNLARRLGMRHFSVHGYWANAELTTNDQALLMENLPRAIFPRYYAYARSLLSSIVSWESWGIPLRARAAGRSSSRAAGAEPIAAS